MSPSFAALGAVLLSGALAVSNQLMRKEQDAKTKKAKGHVKLSEVKTSHAEVAELPDGLQAEFTTDLGQGDQKDKVVLKFIHIPKTGGTSIEDQGSRYGEKHPEAVFGTEWGRFDTAIQCSSPNNRRCKDLRSPGKNGSCYLWHTPPAGDDAVAAYYTRDPVRSFCVVRHPLDRLMSQWKFAHMSNHPETFQCTVHDFNDWAVTQLDEMSSKPYLLDCHMRPQVDYVFDHNGKQVCRHVLRYENLGSEFATLMTNYGLDMELSQRSMQSVNNKTPCVINPPYQMQKLVYDMYKKDYDAFGYPVPDEHRSQFDKSQHRWHF